MKYNHDDFMSYLQQYSNNIPYNTRKAPSVANKI